MEIENPTPVIFEKNADIYSKIDFHNRKLQELDEESPDEFDEFEIFELIRHINDPEHPLTLEQLNVVSVENIKVDNKKNQITVLFTPTIPHCSMASTIGLMIRVKLYRSLPQKFKVSVKISPGSHVSETPLNKQLEDKERIAAALENPHLLKVLNKGVADTDIIV